MVCHCTGEVHQGALLVRVGLRAGLRGRVRCWLRVRDRVRVRARVRVRVRAQGYSLPMERPDAMASARASILSPSVFREKESKSTMPAWLGVALGRGSA